MPYYKESKKDKNVSSFDVPGSNLANHDVLSTGCWAEHEDGSLIFVEGTEGGAVIYSMFDMSKQPIVEYRDKMPERQFKRAFSWRMDRQPSSGGVPLEKWTWHDKTVFPWDKIIQRGFSDGPRLASAVDMITATERVAQSLRLRGRVISKEYRTRAATATWRIADKIRRAVQELRS